MALKHTQTICALALLAAGAARAQTYEVSVGAAFQRMTRAPLGSVSEESPQDDDTRFRNGTGFGVRVTQNTKGYYGHELGYFLNRPILRTTVRTLVNDKTVTTVKEDKAKVHQVFYTFLLYMMPKGERWRPFLAFGLQAQQYQRPRIEEFPPGLSRHYGGNFGAGLKIRLAPHVLFRLDARDYIGGKPYNLNIQGDKLGGGLMHQLEGSAGFAITF